jgi:hypothetical protein
VRERAALGCVGGAARSERRAQYGTVGDLEEGTVVRGSSEIRQLYESEADAWDRQRIEPEKLIDAGERVVVFQREYQRGPCIRTTRR